MTVHAPSQVDLREERRQRAVESLGLGEDLHAERFNRITRVARTLLGTEMSTITVLDRDTACYPGAAGYDATPIPRDQTFCHRTTADDVVTVVPDALLDPRYAHLDAVRSGEVRFYAGVPLRDAIGNVVGVLCVFDPEPAVLEGARLEAFVDLAGWAEQELLAAAERSAAVRVQTSLLPAAPWRADGWVAAGTCLPALAVGGDFYDYGATHGVLHLGLGDVMGKGASAALLGAGVRAALRATHLDVVAGGDLGESMTRVARSVATDLDRAASFVTLFTAAVELDTGLVRYVDAGLGLARLVRHDGSVERLSGPDRPMGILPDDRWTEGRARLEPGDRLVVFSDGLLDLVGDPVDWERPVSQLFATPSSVDKALATVADLAHHLTPLDDVTALVVERAAHEMSGEPR